MKEEEEETPVVSTYNKDDKHFWAAFLNLARHNINTLIPQHKFL